MFYHNIHFFDPQTASIRATFVTFARSCRSVARSVRYVFAPRALQKQPVARLPYSLRPQAPSAKTIVCTKTAFCEYRVRSAIFFLPITLYNPFSFFVKFAPRHRWEAHSWSSTHTILHPKHTFGTEDVLPTGYLPATCWFSLCVATHGILKK